MRDRVYYIKNLEGTVYYKDTPVFEFRIKDCKLEYFKDLSNKKYYPWEFVVQPISYACFVEWLNNRVVKDYAMDIQGYLKQMGLDHYDFEELIKRTNGSNETMHWIRFKDFGAQSWDELLTLDFPVYK